MTLLSFFGSRDEFSLALLLEGIVFRYFSDNIPCARGEKAIQPIP